VWSNDSTSGDVVFMLMQELGLFTIFRGLCHSLWHVWELAITGQPIVVVGTHPELVGDTVLSVISLISPLVFGGDYRPYFSLYDPDFKEVRACCFHRAEHF
jgi:Stabilization of polarity axis